MGDRLRVPATTRRAIGRENSNDEGRLGAILMYWVLRDPVASWRRLIWMLWGGDIYIGEPDDVTKAADSTRHYAEKLSGQSVCRILSSSHCYICVWLITRGNHHLCESLWVCVYVSSDPVAWYSEGHLLGERVQRSHSNQTV